MYRAPNKYDDDWRIWAALVLFFLLVVGGCGTMNFLSKKQLCALYYPEMTPVLCWISDQGKPAAKERR